MKQKLGSVLTQPKPVPVFPSEIAGVNNFACVSQSLYRGEQPTPAGFAELKRRGIRTIVNLRSMHGDSSDLKWSGLRYFHLYAKAWHPEDEDVAAFLKIMDDRANWPVFVHCAQGSDRTGYAVAAYRMVEQNWSCDDAIAEMRHFAFHEIWLTVPAYLECLNVKAMRAKVLATAPPVVRIIN